MLGDYIAIGVDNLSIFVTREEVERFKGAHAGLNEDEMLVPLIVIEKLIKKISFMKHQGAKRLEKIGDVDYELQF